MKITDRVLELMLLNQSTKEAIQDRSGASLGLDVYEDLNAVLAEVAPHSTCDQVQSDLAVIKDSYNPKYWDDFVFNRHMEANCDDGRYIVSLMDDKGEDIPVDERYGLLDMKLNAISDHTSGATQWSAWALMALQNIYAYSADGYAALLCRLNTLQDFIDHYTSRFGASPDVYLIEQAAHILTWNLFQFDEANDNADQILIMDWTNKKTISLLAALKGETYGL